MIYAEHLNVARLAAAAGAAELLSRKSSFSVREKAPRDLVTEADVASQKAIRQVLLSAFPEHFFVGEEEGHDTVPEFHDDPDQQPIWIVDPLDGTVNYVHQLQNYAVSIAMFHEGRLQLGLVHDPVFHEVFWAVRGHGAYVNDRPILTRQTDRLSNALVACSFSAGVENHQEELQRFTAVLARAQAIRRLGSAALNMCYVASGRLDAYWATSVKPWDVAAGAVLVEEAGGILRGVYGGRFNPWDPKFVAAASETLADELVGCF